MGYACTEERFLRDVKDHHMKVLRDDGVDRHLRFRRPGTICYGFDLITWAGHLCITGDCGTYVFARITDMFEFFRVAPRYEGTLHINTGYWHEKVLAKDRHGGCEEYSRDAFHKAIKEWFKVWSEYQPKGLRDEGWRYVEEQVLSHDENEYDAINAALSFSYESLDFQDFWEVNLREYTFRYVWCLYAIVWGIQQYDSPVEAAREKAS